MDKFVKGIWDSSITSELERFIEIPNQSPIFDAEWATNGFQEQVVDMFVAWLKKQPLSGYTVDVCCLLLFVYDH